jgi:hypothetical protein
MKLFITSLRDLVLLISSGKIWGGRLSIGLAVQKTYQIRFLFIPEDENINQLPKRIFL